MTQFTLTIDTTGPAFGEWQTEAARILRAVADELDRMDGRRDLWPRTAVRDSAGKLSAYYQHTDADPKKLTTAPDILPELYDQAEQAGCRIAQFLNLRADKDGRYKTAWGTKTALGLFLSLKRVAVEGLEP